MATFIPAIIFIPGKLLVECPKNTQAIKQAIKDNLKVALYLFRDNQGKANNL